MSETPDEVRDRLEAHPMTNTDFIVEGLCQLARIAEALEKITEDINVRELVMKVNRYNG